MKTKWSFTTFNCRLGYNDSTVSNAVVVVSSDAIYVLFLFLHHIDQVLTWLFFFGVIGIWLGLMEWNEIKTFCILGTWLENWFENVSQGKILRKIRGTFQESFLGIRGNSQESFTGKSGENVDSYSKEFLVTHSEEPGTKNFF